MSLVIRLGPPAHWATHLPMQALLHPHHGFPSPLIYPGQSPCIHPIQSVSHHQARRASASCSGPRMVPDKGLGQSVEVFQTDVRSVGFGRTFAFCHTASVLDLADL